MQSIVTLFAAVSAALASSSAAHGMAPQAGDSTARVERPAAVSQALEQQVADYLQPLLETNNFSGVILVAKSGRVIFQKGFGYASIEHQVPNDPATIFQIASLSKSFTAAAILLLVEQGKLNLKAPLTAILPDYPNGERLTVHHLLTHTSGIPNINDFPEYEGLQLQPQTPAQLVAYFQDKPLEFEPGSRYSYSNSNYNLLALIIEKASGTDYGSFLKSAIFDDLRLQQTGHRRSSAQIISGIATGYSPAGSLSLERAPFLDWSVKTGNGSLYSNAADVLRFMRAVHHGQLLAPASVKATFTQHMPNIGYGWFLTKANGRDIHHINGRSPGFAAQADHYAADDLTVIVLANTYISVTTDIARAVGALALGQPAKPMPQLKPEPLSEQQASALVGAYQFGPDYYVPDALITVRDNGGHLEAMVGEYGSYPLVQITPTRFLLRAFWVPAEFTIGSDGRASEFAIDGLKGSRVENSQTSRAKLKEVSLAIENVTVIDPESRQVLPNHSVYIDGDRIIAVLPRASSAQFTGRRTLDGTGRFLIPGLMDMHVHLFLPNPAAASLNLLLANGVTGIREMSSDCWALAGVEKGCVGEYRKLQSQIRSGEIAGPDLLNLTSTMVMGLTRLKLPEDLPRFITPTTAADARTLVGHLGTRGIDLIKTHDSIPTAAFLALMEEANTLGIRVGGHVPFGVTSLGAARLGYRSIEHARDLLYDCSRYGPEYRRQETAFAEGVPGSKRPSQVDRLERTVKEFDAALCADFLKQLAATGVYYTPTHVTREMEARADEPSYRSDPPRKYVLADRDANWESDLNETASLPAEHRSGLDRFFTHGLRITGLAHNAGVQVMAGTDANDTMIVPGYSLHRELALLNAAGLSNMEALRAATTIPAAYLERSGDLGGIAVGKEADLVLLRSNPLKDISNTASIDAVIANGRVFGRAELDALLREIERLASQSRQKG